MQCFFYNSDELIDKSHSLWGRSMPSSRYGTEVKTPTLSISYGDYFKIVFSTLQNNNFKVLLNIITQQTGEFVTIDSVKYISISLKKHGAFYHPSKLEVCLNKYLLFFVINVAISKEGKAIIEEEMSTLKMLSHTVPLGFLPEVYLYSADNSAKLPMFFGEWFSDFHEFHLSVNQKTRKKNILVWNCFPNQCLLSEKQTRQLYYQIAMIVSSYYDIKSSSQIASWHNASGDFIIKISENFVQTRLISVRKFTPMLIGNIENKDLSWDIILHSLTIFLLYISVHIRLDRLDGIGDLTLTSCNYITHIISGFFQGIYLALINKNYPIDFIVFFKKYLLSYSKNDLSELSFEIINKIYKRRENEASIIISRLDEHVKSLYSSIRNICCC